MADRIAISKSNVELLLKNSQRLHIGHCPECLSRLELLIPNEDMRPEAENSDQVLLSEKVIDGGNFSRSIAKVPVAKPTLRNFLEKMSGKV